MPDWSYRTFLRPLFDRFPDDAARRFAVGVLGRMAALPHGYRIVDALGHMRPDESLARTIGHVEFPSPLGLAPVVDPEGKAVDAFARFGFGFLVVGPVGLDEPRAPLRFARTTGPLGIVAEGSHALGLERARSIAIRTPGAVRLGFELALENGDAEDLLGTGGRLIDGLRERADALFLSPRSFAAIASLGADQRDGLLARLQAAAAEAGVPLFVGAPLGLDRSAEESIASIAASGAGLYLSGRPDPAPDRWSWKESDVEQAVADLGAVRRVHTGMPVVVDAGVLSPRQALAVRAAGADLLLLGSGLVHTGPGLPKRVNEALEHRLANEALEPTVGKPPRAIDAAAAKLPPERRAWFWGAALGAAMLLGAVLAAWSALTAVLLPYDEDFLGRTRAEIEAFNPRIIHFMTHDRLTLAGTMVSIAILYLALSLFGMRKGHHWAQRIVSISAALGFFTFFAFLGFGYFDPFHAFVTLALLQLFIQVVVRPLGTRRCFDAPPHLDNDRAWRLSHWGQLLFVIQACGLLAGGATILTIGVTSVFVAEDIGYLQAAPASIDAFDAKLKPLIAHDRATFGGMLVAAGVALLLTTLWSFRRGDRWLWWTCLLTILPPYAITLWIHVHIGYTNHFHLSPVYIGVLLMIGGLASSAPYLLDGHATPERTHRR